MGEPEFKGRREYIASVKGGTTESHGTGTVGDLGSRMQVNTSPLEDLL